MKLLKISTHSGISATTGPTEFYKLSDNFDLKEVRLAFDKSSIKNSSSFRKILKDNGAINVDDTDMVIDGGTIICWVNEIKWVGGEK